MSAQLLRTPPRRRREKLTDYRQRLKLVKSGQPRLVVRRTNRAIIVQFIQSKASGDNCIVTVTSRKLDQYGWKGSFKNIPAAYLTGLLAGRLAKAAGLTTAVVDLGLHSPVAGSRLFAVVKGAADAGISIPFSDDVIPSEERLRGEHIKQYFDMIAGKPNTVQFARCDPAFYSSITDMLDAVRKRILEGVGG
jgi:large subunit ribosomal protein L18